MENNLVTYTKNYNLATVGEDQDGVKFKDFRNELMGTSQSNMTKIDEALASKQDVLIPDSSPVSGSTNAVSSGGVYNALLGKADSLILDGNHLRLSSAGEPLGDIVTISRSVQPDWDETNSSSMSYIKNKPVLSGDTLATTKEIDIIDIAGTVKSTSAYSEICSIDAGRLAMIKEYAKAYNINTVQSVTLGGAISSIIETNLGWEYSGNYSTIYVTGTETIIKISSGGTVSIYRAGTYGYSVGDEITVKVTVSCPKLNSVYLDEDIVRKASFDALSAEIESIKAQLANLNI